MTSSSSLPEGNWNYPTAIRFGAGRISELAEGCQESGIYRPLLITDEGLAGIDFIDKIHSQLAQAGLPAHIFSQVKSNPSGENVTAGVAAYNDHHCDGIIAVGGGSALDAGKAIALMVGQQRPLWDFEDCDDNWRLVNIAAMAPVIAVPTTAGTGSEVGRAAVIVDSEERRKKIIFHPKILPAMVIADPELTVGLPVALTAATGMDALVHNLEAFFAPGYHPMAEGIAMEAITLIHQWLPRAVADGSDIEARSHMLAASMMGATAFQKGLGAVHALAHPLGALFDSHHGLLNAILLPYVLQANRSAIEAKAAQIAYRLELAQANFDGLLSWITQLRKTLEIPHNLSAIGIGAQDALLVGKMATEDACAGGNPIIFNAQQYADIFQDAVSGSIGA